MSRIFTVSYTGTLTAAGGDCDLGLFQPADDKPILLKGFEIGQTSEVGDAAEENIRISILRLPATVTPGSGGSTPTPQPMDSNNAAAGFTARCNDTTVATTSGTAATLGEMAWNERNTPFEKMYPDDEYSPRAQQGEGLVVRNQTSVADDISITLTFTLKEL